MRFQTSFYIHSCCLHVAHLQTAPEHNTIFFRHGSRRYMLFLPGSFTAYLYEYSIVIYLVFFCIVVPIAATWCPRSFAFPIFLSHVWSIVLNYSYLYLQACASRCTHSSVFFLPSSRLCCRGTSRFIVLRFCKCSCVLCKLCS